MPGTAHRVSDQNIFNLKAEVIRREEANRAAFSFLALSNAVTAWP